MSAPVSFYECVKYTYNAHDKSAHVELCRTIRMIELREGYGRDVVVPQDERHRLHLDLNTNTITCTALNSAHAVNEARVARDFKDMWDELLEQVGDPAELEEEALYISA